MFLHGVCCLARRRCRVSTPGAIALLATLLGGCANSRQTQYFAVVDPRSNNINFYRLTIEGDSGLLNQYSLKAGYFNAVTVDALTGSFSDPPEVKGDDAQIKAVAAIRQTYYSALQTEAQAAAIDIASDNADDRVKTIAKAYWLAGLDDLSLMSVGQTGSLDPYVFRKLVFWAEAQPTDLQQLESQFDNIFKNTSAVVGALRNGKNAATQPTTAPAGVSPTAPAGRLDSGQAPPASKPATEPLPSTEPSPTTGESPVPNQPKGVQG